MGLTYCLKVPATAASMPAALCAAVVGQRCRVDVAPRPGGSPVNHRSCTPCRHGRHSAPARAFARRIGWREPEFAQQCAQGDAHLHVGERRADATVDAAAERNPRHRLRDAADESVRVESRRGRSPLVVPANPQAYAQDPSLQHDCGMRCRMTSSGGDDHVLALRRAAIAARAAVFSATHEFSLSTPAQLQGDRWPS